MSDYVPPPAIARKVAKFISPVWKAAPSEKPAAFAVAARYVFGLAADRDFPQTDAADWLQNTAVVMGLVGTYGEDEVQHWLAEAADSPLFEDEQEIRREFLRQCLYTDGGTLICNLANTLTALRTALPHIVAYDDMGRTTVNVMGNTVAVLLVRRFANVKDDAPIVTDTDGEVSPLEAAIVK